MVPRDKPEGDGKRGLAGVLLAALLAACATTPEIGWQARHAAAEALREAVRFSETPLPNAWTGVAITTTPVAINDPDLEVGAGGVVYVGGFQITSEFNRLHGLSDIKFQDQSRFVAVTDEGLLVRGALALDAGGRPTGLNDVAVRPLTDPDGQALVPKYLADAEGLAILPNGELLVSFERLHRVWRYDREGRWLGERVIPDFAFTENEGMEGIGATVHADQFWAAGEDGGLWWCFTVRCGVFISPPAVTPTDDDLRTTSLVTLDGTIYRLERAYHAARNTNTIQISELELVEGAAEPSLAWRTLATFTAPATVDNFEGIAAVRRPDGGVRLYILSDDNFNPGQRTLLLAFDVR